MIEAYKQGLLELDNGDVIYAFRKFNEVKSYTLNQYGLQELH